VASYVITYDLNKAGQNYEALEKAIKSYNAWAKIATTTFASAPTTVRTASATTSKRRWTRTTNCSSANCPVKARGSASARKSANG
jgi:hypothetical protein